MTLREYTDIIPRDKVCFVRNILLDHDQSAPKYESIANEDILAGDDSDAEDSDVDADRAKANSASSADTFNPGKQTFVPHDPEIETANV